MDTSYLSVNESHVFVFPVMDFGVGGTFAAGTVSGAVNAGPQLKLPAQGNWWVWGLNATRVTTGSVGEMASGTNIGMNIYDSGLSQFWWTGGSLLANAMLPIQCVCGKAGEAGVFAEPKLVRGGSILTPYFAQYSGGTPAGSSQLYVTMLVTLASSAQGDLPVVPSLGGFVNQRKGESYKSLVQTPWSTNNLAAGSTVDYAIALNKETSMIINQIVTDFPMTDTSYKDPRVSDPNVLVNLYDTRTTWKWATPTGCPISLFFGSFAARPFAAPSYFYMEADQNLALEVTNNTGAALTSNMNVVLDGYLNENILGKRVRS